MKFVLLLFNIQKNTNLGNLIRTANAFGALEICVIGRKKFSSYGNHRTQSETKFRHFYRIEEAFCYYRELGFDFVGVEISQNSISINNHAFTQNTVFIMGNEASGISSDVIEKCDYCVFIPQFGSGASINVNVACGIVLNAFNSYNREHNSIVGAKFIRNDK